MELIWTISILPYPGRLGELLNVLCCVLPVATQQERKFSSAGCRRKVEICLRTLESGNHLGYCFIWDIAIEDCALEREHRKTIIVAYPIVKQN